MKNVSIKGWLLAGLATTLLAGCEIGSATPDSTAWQDAAETHTCTIEAQARVERDALLCNINAAYTRAYCYGAAIVRNCDKIEPEKSNEDAASADAKPEAREIAVPSREVIE